MRRKEKTEKVKETVDCASSCMCTISWDRGPFVCAFFFHALGRLPVPGSASAGVEGAFVAARTLTMLNDVAVAV